MKKSHKYLIILFLLMALNNESFCQWNKFKEKYIDPVGDAIGKTGQDAIDIARGKKKADEVVKHWYDELKDEVEKAVGETMQVSGDLLQIIGENSKVLIEITEEDAKSLVNLNKKLTEIGVDIVGEITPDGPWKVDLGVAEIKSHKSIEDRLSQYNKELHQEFEKGVEIQSKILSVAADGVTYSGVFLEYFGKYYAASIQGFPSKYSNQTQSINDVDREIFLSNHLLNSIIIKLTEQPYKYGEKGNEYIHLHKLSFNFQPDLNTISLIINDGIIGWDADKVRGAFKINTGEIQLIPVIVNEGDDFKLFFGARLVNLDIKDCPPRIEKMIAWAIQDNVLNMPVIEESINDLVHFNTEVEIKGKKISSGKFDLQKRTIKVHAAIAQAIVAQDKFYLKIKNK